MRTARTGRLAAAFICTLLLAACAGPAAKGVSFRDPGMTMERAGQAIVAGQSTRADVLATLGPATAVRFDSGFEVWVYRTPGASSAEESDEFVVLFDPQGIVRKTRTRRA